MIKKIENMDENALVDLALLRDYFGAIRELTSEELGEVDRLWKMIPTLLFTAVTKWEVDIYELLHEATHAWLKTQSGPDSPILVIKKGRVWLDTTLQKGEEGEERIDLRPYYMAGYTFFKTLAIIARHLR